MKLCPKCNKLNKDSANFCRFCGTSLRSVPSLKKHVTQSHKTNMIKCPNCHKMNFIGNEFCNYCGTRLNGNSVKPQNSLKYWIWISVGFGLILVYQDICDLLDEYVFSSDTVSRAFDNYLCYWFWLLICIIGIIISLIVLKIIRKYQYKLIKFTSYMLLFISILILVIQMFYILTFNSIYHL